MPDALTILRAYASWIGGEVTTYEPTDGFPDASVVLRAGRVKLVASCEGAPDGLNTVGQAASDLVQTLWRYDPTQFLTAGESSDVQS